MLLVSCPATDAAGFTGPLELARRINRDATCTRTRILGLCWCGGTACGYQVSMYVPVAFVETVRAAGDSLLASAPWLPLAPIGEAPGTVSSRQSGLDNTAEVHAWTLGDAVWTVASMRACLECRPSDAVSPAAGPAGAAPSQPGLASWSTMLPALAYASELDGLNWHTGWRDLQAVAAGSLSLSGTAGQLGRWGALYPRQMRDLGTTPVVYSAKTAFRALSMARDQFATFSAPVDLAARMQQAFPVVSACFAVGEQPLPQVPASGQPVRASADGRYGWFYWRPVTCCVGFASLARCAQP